MRVSSRIALNQVVRWGAAVAQGLIALAMVPFLLRSLGKDGYGLATLLMTIVALCAMADLGLRTALGRHLAEELTRGRHERFNELLSSAFYVALTTGGLAGLLWAVLAPGLTGAFNLPPSLAAEAAFMIRWYGAVAIALSFLLPVYSATLFASGRSDIVDGIAAVTNILQAISLLLVLGLTTAGLPGWALVSLAELVVRFLAVRTFGLRVAPFARIQRGLVRRDVLGHLFSTSAYAFMLQMMHAVNVYADPLILTTILGPSAVAIYRAGTVLPMRIQPLFTLADQLQPFATNYYVSRQTEKLQETLIRGTRYTLLLGILPCVVLGVFAEPIIRFWLGRALGPDYQAAAYVLVGWVIVELLASAGGAQWPIFLAVNKLRFLAWSQVPFSLLNLTISIVLVAWTSAGVLGVVIGTIVTGAIRRPMLVIHAARACGLSPWTYARNAYVRPLAVLAILAGIASSWVRFGLAESIPGLLLGIAATGLAWLALTWSLGLTGNDRRQAQTMIARSATAVRFAGLRRTDAGLPPAK